MEEDPKAADLEVRDEISGPGAAEGPGVGAPPPVIYGAGLGIGLALDAVLPSAAPPAAVRWTLGSAFLAGR